jgi:hypothetical protein
MSVRSSRKLIGCWFAFFAVASVPLVRGQAGAPAAAENPQNKFAEATRGMQAINGLFTFYRNSPDDDSKDHSRLLAVIPRGLLNQDLMLAGTISRGSEFGLPIDDGTLVRWEQSGNRLLLVAPDTRLKEIGNDPVLGAVRHTYTDSLLAGFPVLGSDASGGQLIDLTDAIYSGINGVSLGAVRRDLSKLVKVKSFPENAVVDVDVATMTGGNSARWTGISYAFRKLPPLGTYQPRLADERIGYFTTVSRDWAAKYSDHENLTRYINRWNIKKLDPSLELSPPDKPIVFILEKTIPIQFRKYVADGISEWNKAFEKVGITQAIVVQQQTDDNEYANVDPDDARYNFIRWIVTGRGFAMGPSRADPRTGQLLDADIVFDDSMVRFYMEDNDILGPHALSSSLGDQVLTFFRENPAFLPAGVELPSEDRELLKPVAPTADTTNPHADLMPLSGASRQCAIGNGLQQQLAFAQMAASAAGSKKLPDRIIGEIVKDIVTHEVGHTLGLRHNFKGSAWLSIDEIKKRRDTGDEPTWSSVMDYNPYLYFPGDKIEQVRHLTSPTIGPYDYWAIEYGYSTPAAGKSEADHLSAIASKTNTRELAYATDEDVMGFDSPDPSANRFDMGSDPVEWAKMRIALSDELLKSVKDWGLKKDEPNYYFRSVYSTLAFERVRYIPFVAREVTGIYESRSRAGDPNAPSPFTLIPPAKQRAALKFIGDTLFSESFFNADPDLLNKLGANRWMDWASYPAARTDYPVHAAVLSMQAGTLAALTNQTALQRVYDSESKSKSDDKFTAAELISTLRDSIWAELDQPAKASTDAKPMIGSFRRNLQQQYLQNMLSIAELKPGVGVSPDVQNMIRYSLRELSTKIAKSLEAKDQIDFATRAHLNEARVKIDRVLDAPYVPSSGGQPIIIMMGRDTGAK